ncbi:MAG: amidohydrolase [Oscillospiraceae bacterium]|nr:amidohydrolase [Oscillospiraceae bacterium]
MSILFRDVLGLFYDANGQIAPRTASVYVADGKIAGVDRPPANFVPARTIDGAGKLLIPGLVNSHTHSYMTILRNAADDLTFHDWLFGTILPLEEKLTPEDCYWGTQLGLMEMLSTGTTSFLDMYIFPHAAAQAVRDAGGRAVLSKGLVAEGGAEHLRQAEEEMRRWKDEPQISFFLAPHAPYTCDPGYQREVAALAKQLDVGIHTHISESQREVTEIWSQYGKSPVSLLAENNLLTNRTVAAHCVHLDQHDIATLAAHGVSVAHNPVSNLKLACGIAPVPKLRAAGVNVSLGTDGSASNNTLNLFGDLRLAALLHKGISGDPQLITAAEGVEMATVNGAKALGLQEKVGQIAVGFDADLALLDLGRLNMQPNTNPLAALAYSAGGHEVELTMVRGKVLYEKGAFPTMDKRRILHEVEAICRRIGL